MMRIVFIICILIVLFGAWRWRLNSYFGGIEKYNSGDRLKVSGSIANQPYQKGSKQIISIGWYSAYVDPFPRYSYGDKIVVSGRLDKKLTDFNKPRLILMDPTIQLIEQEQGRVSSAKTSVVRSVMGVRIKLMQQLGSFLPEPQSSLLLGILLGVKRNLQRDFYEALRSTGTLHVVVASGYNVTVVAGLVALVAIRFVARRWAIPVILLAVFVYTLMAGAEPPIVRAAIMSGLAFVAQMLGKQYHGLWALVVTGFVMLLVSPILIFDIGFQLSVAATLGILVVSPMLFFGLKKLRKWLWKSVIDDLAVTLGAQLMVLPILLVHFKQVSWFSPLVNMAVGFVVPIIMGMGGILAAISLVSGQLAQIFALFTWVPLSYFIGVVSWFDGLPFGVLVVNNITWWWVVGYYLVMGVVVLKFLRKRNIGQLMKAR